MASDVRREIDEKTEPRECPDCGWTRRFAPLDLETYEIYCPECRYVFLDLREEDSDT